METFKAILCHACENKEATVECDDCTPSSETEPMLLCAACSSVIHHGRMGKHTVIPLGIREKKQSLERQLEELQKRCTEFKHRRKQLALVKEDIKERVTVYEKCIKDRLTTLIQQLKQRGNQMFKTLKGISQERIKKMEQAERFADVIIREVAQASKEVAQIDKEPGLLSDKLDDKIKMLKNQLSEIKFDELVNKVPSSRINHDLDDELLNTLSASIDTINMTVHDGEEESIEKTDSFQAVTKEHTTFLADSIIEGHEMSVNVSGRMDQTGSFFVTPIFMSSIWEQMLDHSHRMRWEYVCNLELQPIPESCLEKGLLCYALRDDQMWYRAVIEEIPQPPKSPGVTVSMADFGIVIPNMPANHLFEYRVRHGMNLPFQAVHCKLACNPGDAANNVNTRMRFVDYVKDRSILCRFITPFEKTKESESGTTWLVDLFVEKPNGKSESISTLLERSAGDHNAGDGSKFKSKDIRLANDDLSKSLTHISTTISSQPDSTELSTSVVKPTGVESDAIKGHQTLDRHRSRNSKDDGISDLAKKKKRKKKKVPTATLR